MEVDKGGPSPNDVHRHLIALFAEQPRRVWTSNYDDLLEKAARDIGVEPHPVDPTHRHASNKLPIAHLHGFLPLDKKWVERRPPPPEPTLGVILAEDDYHKNTKDTLGWTNREFHRLFDEHRVLILGMSLTDRNLRRVLATAPVSKYWENESPRHFAVMRSLSLEECAERMLQTRFDEYLKKTWREEICKTLIEENEDDIDLLCEDLCEKISEIADSKWLNRDEIDVKRLKMHHEVATKVRSEYWQRHGVNIVEVPHYESILPFLVRLRYESYGKERGDLWDRGAEIGYQAIRDPWNKRRQENVRNSLNGRIQRLQQLWQRDPGLRQKLAIDPTKILDVGIFLLKDRQTLQLIFRSSKICNPRSSRKFSANPDKPTGLVHLGRNEPSVRPPADGPCMST